jgi:hypothetical protein
MKDAAPFSVELESAKLAFLEEMARTYKLPDPGKAIRCLIDYARTHAERRDEIFGEIRCIDCGA